MNLVASVSRSTATMWWQPPRPSSGRSGVHPGLLCGRSGAVGASIRAGPGRIWGRSGVDLGSIQGDTGSIRGRSGEIPNIQTRAAPSYLLPGGDGKFEVNGIRSHSKKKADADLGGNRSRDEADLDIMLPGRLGPTFFAGLPDPRILQRCFSQCVKQTRMAKQVISEITLMARIRIICCAAFRDWRGRVCVCLLQGPNALHR